jgi:hypothetical protein
MDARERKVIAAFREEMAQQAAQVQALQAAQAQTQQDLHAIRLLLEAQLNLGSGKRNTEERDPDAANNANGQKKHRPIPDGTHE